MGSMKIYIIGFNAGDNKASYEMDPAELSVNPTFHATTAGFRFLCSHIVPLVSIFRANRRHFTRGDFSLLTSISGFINRNGCHEAPVPPFLKQSKSVDVRLKLSLLFQR